MLGGPSVARDQSSAVFCLYVLCPLLDKIIDLYVCYYSLGSSYYFSRSYSLIVLINMALIEYVKLVTGLRFIPYA